MKHKTHKSFAKRIKITKTGKLLRRRILTQHLVVKKSRRAVKNAGRNVVVSYDNAKRIRKSI